MGLNLKPLPAQVARLPRGTELSPQLGTGKTPVPPGTQHSFPNSSAG